MSEPAIDIRDVSIQFQTELGVVQALRHVSLTIQPGEIVVLVGESGCGKSVLCRSILKLLPRNSKQTTGQILLGQRNITSYTEKQMEQLRGKTLAMVFQNPLTTLNPSMTMGTQLREAICHRQQMSRAAADARASELLQLVGIADGAHRLDLLPQAFSGGQRQRCSLAIALAQEPQILIADEPTTALDVTVQLEILDLLRNLQRRQDLTILFVTHDLGVAARIADRIGIMYAGKLVEIGTADDIFYDARHPYTWGLLGARRPYLWGNGLSLSPVCRRTCSSRLEATPLPYATAMPWESIMKRNRPCLRFHRHTRRRRGCWIRGPLT